MERKRKMKGMKMKESKRKKERQRGRKNLMLKLTNRTKKINKCLKNKKYCEVATHITGDHNQVAI